MKKIKIFVVVSFFIFMVGVVNAQQLSSQQMQDIIIKNAEKTEELKNKLKPSGNVVFVNGKTIKGLRTEDKKNADAIVTLGKKLDELSATLKNSKPDYKNSVEFKKAVEDLADARLTFLLSPYVKIGKVKCAVGDILPDGTKALTCVDRDETLLEATIRVLDANYASKSDIESTKNDALEQIPTVDKTVEALKVAGYKTDAELVEKFASKETEQKASDALAKAGEAMDKAVSAETSAQDAKKTAGDSYALGQATANDRAQELAKKDRSQFYRYSYELAKRGFSFNDVGLKLTDLEKKGWFKGQSIKNLSEELVKGFSKVDAKITNEKAQKLVETLLAGLK